MLFGICFGGMNESLSMFCNKFHISVHFLIDPCKTHTHILAKRDALESYWPGIQSWLLNLLRVISAIQRTFTACCLQGCVVDARCEQVINMWSLLLRSHCLNRETGKNKQFQMGVRPPHQAGGSQGSLLRGGDTWPVFEGEFAT